MRIAICDDQPAQLLLLQEQCRRWGKSRGESAELLSFTSAETFLFAYEIDKQIDVLLLDIQMPGLSGMELAQKLRAENDALTFALITATPDFALQGYEVSALAYLLKPVSDEALFSLLDRAKKQSAPPCLLVDHDGVTERLPLSDILYLESDGHHTRIVCMQKTFESPHVLSHFESLLQEQFPGSFHRCHRCYLIHLAHAASIHKKEVVMDQQHTVPVARGRFEPLSQAYMAYYRNMI